MSRPDPIRVLVLSVVKHDYLPKAVASHPRFQLVAVADDPDRPAALSPPDRVTLPTELPPLPTWLAVVISAGADGPESWSSLNATTRYQYVMPGSAETSS